MSNFLENILATFFFFLEDPCYQTGTNFVWRSPFVYIFKLFSLHFLRTFSAKFSYGYFYFAILLYILFSNHGIYIHTVAQVETFLVGPS
jgi:hypothetical protein